MDMNWICLKRPPSALWAMSGFSHWQRPCCPRLNSPAFWRKPKATHMKDEPLKRTPRLGSFGGLNRQFQPQILPHCRGVRVWTTEKNAGVGYGQLRKAGGKVWTIEKNQNAENYRSRRQSAKIRSAVFRSHKWFPINVFTICKSDKNRLALTHRVRLCRNFAFNLHHIGQNFLKVFQARRGNDNCRRTWVA